MPAFIAVLLSLLGAVPIIEKLLAGFGTLISTEAKKLFGDAAGTQVESDVNYVEGIIQDFDTAATDFEATFMQEWPDIQSLIAEFSFLPKMLLTHRLAAAKQPTASASYVINVVQAAHANVRVAANQAPQARKP